MVLQKHYAVCADPKSPVAEFCKQARLISLQTSCTVVEYDEVVSGSLVFVKFQSHKTKLGLNRHSLQVRDH